MATAPLSLTQRLLRSLPGIIQGGVDAAATPNVAFGGPTDIFRAISNSGDLASQRELLRLKRQQEIQQMQLERERQELAEKQYQRLVEANEASARNAAEVLAFNREKDRADNERADKNLQATFANAGLNPDGTPRTEMTLAQRVKAQDEMGARDHSAMISTPLMGGFRSAIGTPQAENPMAAQLPIGATPMDINPLQRLAPPKENPIPKNWERVVGTSGDQQMIMPDFQTRSNIKLPTTFQGAAVRSVLGTTDSDQSDPTIARLRRVQEALRNPTTWNAEIIAAVREGDEPLVDELIAKSKAAGVGAGSGGGTEAERFVRDQYEPYKQNPTQQNWEKGLKAWATARQQPQRPPQVGMIVDGTYQQLRPGAQVGPGAVTPAGMSSVNVPTSTTRTMTETAPAVLSFVDKLIPMIQQGRAELGPDVGRWNDLMTGKVGLENPTFARLRTNLGLLETAIMRMHVGARGGDQMMEHFHNLIGSAVQNPENMLATLDEIKLYANVILSEGRLKNQTPAGTPPVAGQKRPEDMTSAERQAEIDALKRQLGRQ